MKNRKTIKISLDVKPFSFGGYDPNAEFFKEDWEYFRNKCGGELAIALFEGKFPQALHKIIRMAEARGAYNYHQHLLEDNKKS